MTDNIIATAYLHEKAREDYYDYSVEVIEDRAIFGEDGLKPVARRLLWAAHKMPMNSTSRFVKAARLVGETMGKFHPHGDQAIEGALVTAANMPLALFDKSGNWGTLTDNAAASRYIECRLSKYSDTIFFDKFYLNAINYVPNYDDSDVEPLILPSLLPNSLLNGNFGIAPGVRTQTPIFTLESIVKCIVQSMKDGKATPKSCMNLEFTTEYGGILRRTPTIKQELEAFYKTGNGRFTFDSDYEDNEKHIRIDRFAPIGSLDGKDTKKGYKPGILDRVAALNGVSSIRDDTSDGDVYDAYVVEFQKTLKGQARDAVINKVMGMFSASVTYNVQIVERTPSKIKTQGEKKLRSTNIPEIINRWIEYRIHLEKKACKFWINKRSEEIKYQNLLRLAVKNRSFIIKALDKKFTDEQLAAYIAKGLGVTVEEADKILDLKVRQLKSLEDNKLVEKIRVLKEEINGYKLRIEKPKSYIAKQIVGFSKELAPN